MRRPYSGRAPRLQQGWRPPRADTTSTRPSASGGLPVTGARFGRGPPSRGGRTIPWTVACSAESGPHPSSLWTFRHPSLQTDAGLAADGPGWRSDAVTSPTARPPAIGAPDRRRPAVVPATGGAAVLRGLGLGVPAIWSALPAPAWAGGRLARGRCRPSLRRRHDTEPGAV